MARRKIFEAVINAAQELRKLGGTQAERMARAAEQGYDTSRTLYHGGANDFDAFAESRRGVYLSDNPDIAGIYADNAQKRWPGQNNAEPNIIAGYAKGKPLVVSDQGPGGGGWLSDNMAKALNVSLDDVPTVNRAAFLNDEARRQGYGYIEIQNMDDLGGNQTQIRLLDNSNFRSVNADFNPEYRDSPNLLAGIAGAMPYAGATAAALAGVTGSQEAEAGTMSAAAKAYAKYMSKRTWKSADEATAYLREKIAKDNAAGWGRPVDPAIVDEFNFVKHGKDVKISQRGMAEKRKPVGFTLEQDGAAMVGDWGKKDLNDYTEGFADQLRGYVDLDSIPQEKLAGGYNAYGWEELSRGGEIPPITLKANKNGSLSILDGNHRLRFARDRGDDQIPAIIVGEVKGLTPRERGSVNPLLLAGTATLAGTGMALNSREAEAGPLQTLGRAAPYLTSAALGGAAALQSGDAEAGPLAAGRRVIEARFLNALGGSNPRVGLKDVTEEMLATVDPRTLNIGPEQNLYDYEGSPYILTQSDRSAAGGMLTSVHGTPIDPVDLRGGRDFMFDPPSAGQVWASDPNVVSTLHRRASELAAEHGSDPLLLPYTMAPTGIDFATMPLETMIGYARAKMGVRDTKRLDKKIREIIPSWGGVANPASVAVFREVPGDSRKLVADMIDKEFRESRGGLSISEARVATSDAAQYLSPSGQIVNVGRIDTSSPVIADSGHPTYVGGLPGEGIGRLAQPLDVRPFMAGKGRDITGDQRDIRALDMNHSLSQGVITEGLLRSIYGNANPLLLGGLAAGTGAGMAIASQDADAGKLDALGRAAPYLATGALGAAMMTPQDAQAEPISIMPPTYNDTMQRTQAAINKIDQFKAKRAGKRGAMDQMKLELQTLLKGANEVANDVIFPALSVGAMGVLSLTDALGAMALKSPTNRAMYGVASMNSDKIWLDADRPLRAALAGAGALADVATGENLTAVGQNAQQVWNQDSLQTTGNMGDQAADWIMRQGESASPNPLQEGAAELARFGLKWIPQVASPI